MSMMGERGEKEKKGDFDVRDSIRFSGQNHPSCLSVTSHPPCRMTVSRYNGYHSKTDPLRRRMQDKDARVSAAGH